MTLILGGRCSGKREFALSLGYNEDEIKDDFTGKIVYKLNDIIKNTPINSVEEMMSTLENLSDDLVIICDEIGCGIVPIHREDREYRELVGRCCCLVAKKSEHVYRIYAGIASKIK